MSRIFISYRREDSAAYAGRLYDWLSQHFGKENIFIDVDTIQPGDDFVEAVEQKVGGCNALLALIGKEWLNCRDDEGNRRLDNEGDFVRVEIVSALNRNVRVIPVLVEGARMPAERDLPAPFAKLARRQALELSFTRFHQDANRLIETLESSFAAAEERRKTEQVSKTPVAPEPTPPAPEPRVNPNPVAIPAKLPAQASQPPPGRGKVLIGAAGVAVVAVIGALAYWYAPRPVEKPAPRPASSAPASPHQQLPPAAQPPVIEFFSVDQSVLESGGSATLRWSVRGGSVRLDPDVGPVADTGTRAVAPQSSATYDLVATGPGGVARQSLTIAVKPVPAPSGGAATPPIVEEFAVQPDSVGHDRQATLRWRVRGGTSVTLGPGIGKVGANGTRVIRPQRSTTYALVAQGPGGVTRRSVTLTVESGPPAAGPMTPAANPPAAIPPTIAAPPTIEEFTAQPNPVVRDQQATLRWKVKGATGVTLGPGNGTVADTGTLLVTPGSSTTYELEAHGPGGVTKARVELKVTPPAAAPITIQLSASSLSIRRGENSVLRWAVTNADHVSIDHGIGRVDSTGSRRLSPSETTVYKLTASGGGQEKEAAVEIVVNTPSGQPSERSGSLVWKGDLRPFGVLEIDSASVTKGTLRGALPRGVPLKIDVMPVEVKKRELPSQANGWRLVLQNDSKRRGEVTINWQLIQP